LNSAETPPSELYSSITPSLDLGLPYIQAVVSADFHEWPKLPDLLPSSFPGVQSKRDSFVVDIDENVLRKRIGMYFDPAIPDTVARAEMPEAFIATSQYDPKKVRDALSKRGVLRDRFVKYLYRPFDFRWLYWEHEHNLLSRRSPDLFEACFAGNTFIEAREKQTGEDFSRGTITSTLPDNFGNGFSSFFPLYLHDHPGGNVLRPNLSQSLERFLQRNDLKSETIFYHITAILHAPLYRAENAGALRMGWPRVPVPGDAKRLQSSADLGNRVVELLDAEKPVSGVNRGKLRPGFRVLGLPHKKDGKPLSDEDLAVSAGWGHVQTSRTGSTLVMPGSGFAEERDYTIAERTALSEEGKTVGNDKLVFDLLGDRTFDIYLNDNVMWTNVPIKVWQYTLGGYQVIKKWLSYREAAILGRRLTPEEVAFVSEMIRRIAAILLLSPALDANYMTSKVDTVEWKDGRPVVP
jgi:hypothetical protein